jgi:hypothetical protein
MFEVIAPELPDDPTLLDDPEVLEALSPLPPVELGPTPPELEPVEAEAPTDPAVVLDALAVDALAVEESGGDFFGSKHPTRRMSDKEVASSGRRMARRAPGAPASAPYLRRRREFLAKDFRDASAVRHSGADAPPWCIRDRLRIRIPRP